ncbi:hypothetical protein D3C71_2043170 [compost metagenome]
MTTQLFLKQDMCLGMKRELVALTLVEPLMIRAISYKCGSLVPSQPYHLAIALLTGSS